MKNFKICDLFTNCGILNDFPFPINDFDSLTEYEMLLKCIKHIKKLWENDSTLTNRINALYNYVTDYFKNLDLQDEVNKKIDEMVESGQLQEIITEYLQINGVLAFNTVEDLKSATNVINGSIVKTVGYYNINDKGGSYYVISNSSLNDIRSILLNNGLYANMILTSSKLYAKQFGVYGDKTHNDLTNLQALINFAKTNNYEIILDGFSYISDTLDVKGVKISGIGNPANGGGEYTSSEYGYIGWDYLRNTGDGALITFNDYKNDMLKQGSGIISDIANPIIECKHKDGKFNLENLCICGWLRNETQEGLLSTYQNDDTYIYGSHKFKDIYVINCGSNGIHLQSLETTVIENLNCSWNFGYGCYIEGVSGKDTPFEYVELHNCHFNGNKLGGFYAHNCYRKQVKFSRCQANSSGLYSQLGINLPETTQELIFGFKIDGKESSSNSARTNLVFENCYGESTNKLIELLFNGDSTYYVSNNIDLHNNIAYPSTQNDICCLLYFDSYYTERFNLYNNYFNGNNLLITSNENLNVIPLLVDNTYNKIVNVKTPTVSSKITVSESTIKRNGNLITMSIFGTTNDNIAAWENIISGFTTPQSNFAFPMLVGNEVYQCMLYTSGECSQSQAITSGKKIIINVTYPISLSKVR